MAVFNAVWTSLLAGFVLGYLFGNAVYQAIKHFFVTAYQDVKAKITGA